MLIRNLFHIFDYINLFIMHLNLKISTNLEYFSQTDREIDWEEDDNTKVPMKQANMVQEILATEISIFLLRNVSGICGSLVDTMYDINKELIKKYENEYEAYVKYNRYD